MRRTRNPRYAPEFLERKLSPSSFGLVTTVQVAPMITLADNPPPAVPRPYEPPPSPSPFPPVILPGYPGGPGEPANV